MPSLFALDWVHHYGTGERNTEHPPSNNNIAWETHLRSTRAYLAKYGEKILHSEEFVRHLTEMALHASEMAMPGGIISRDKYTLLVPGHIHGALEWLSNELDRLVSIAGIDLPRACLVLYRINTTRHGETMYVPLFHTVKPWQEQIDRAAMKPYVLKRFKKSVMEELHRLHPKGTERSVTINDVRAAVYRLAGVLPFVDEGTRRNLCRPLRMEAPCLSPSSIHVDVYQMMARDDYNNRITSQLLDLKRENFPHLTLPRRADDWHRSYNGHGIWYYTTVDSTVVSMCYVDNRDDQWTIWDVATRTGFKRKGYGSAVVQEVIGNVPMNIPLRIHVVAGTPSTVFLTRMYQILGFVLEGNSVNGLLPMVYPAVTMVAYTSPKK